MPLAIASPETGRRLSDGARLVDIVGGTLELAGQSGWCGMAKLLARTPWNWAA